jgi:hypothetical protein
MAALSRRISLGWPSARDCAFGLLWIVLGFVLPASRRRRRCHHFKETNPILRGLGPQMRFRRKNEPKRIQFVAGLEAAKAATGATGRRNPSTWFGRGCPVSAVEDKAVKQTQLAAFLGPKRGRAGKQSQFQTRGNLARRVVGRVGSGTTMVLKTVESGGGSRYDGPNGPGLAWERSAGEDDGGPIGCEHIE